MSDLASNAVVVLEGWWVAAFLIPFFVVAAIVYLAGRRSSARTWKLVGIGIALAGVLAATFAHTLPASGGRGSGSRAYAGGRWDGVPLGGAWVRTSLTVQTNAILEDPDHPGVIWAGTNEGMWISPDGGVTWRRESRGIAGHGILSLTAARALHEIVAGGDDGGVYIGKRRVDGAWKWKLVNRPLGSSYPIFCLAVLPSTGRTILAGTSGSVYRGTRTRGGWTWKRVASAGNSGVTSVAWAPWNPRLAFAAVFGTWPPVLVSRDGGRTWKPDVAGLPKTLPSQALQPIQSRPPGIVYTTMGGGVWKQSGNGAWRDISSGLPARHGMPVALAWRGGKPVLYTGTMGFGVYGKEGNGPWQLLGSGLAHGDHTVLGLAVSSGAHPALLAATALGVFRYLPPR